MFIKTFKTSKTELVIIIIGLICFVATLWYIISSASSGGQENTSAAPSERTEEFLTSARTADERLKFLAQFGWVVEPDPIDVREVVIPAEFDDVYNSYNEIQKTLGFNLEKYKGRRVKKWEDAVINYPEGVRNVKATLLIRDGAVIGGDISAGGNRQFVHSLLLSKALKDDTVVSSADYRKK